MRSWSKPCLQKFLMLLYANRYLQDVLFSFVVMILDMCKRLRKYSSFNDSEDCNVVDIPFNWSS